MNRNILNMKPSGIRRFTALAKETPGCKMLTIGEPDFDTPAPIQAAAAVAMAQGFEKLWHRMIRSRRSSPRVRSGTASADNAP